MPVIKRKIRDFITFAFVGFGFLWAVIESFGFFLPERKPEGVCWYAAIVFAALGVALWNVRPKRNIEVKVPASDSSLAIKFGDIFTDKGVVVIPVNEYFDGELNGHVSENSLHGLFIKNVLGGQSEVFYNLTDIALDSIVAEKVQRKSGRDKRYPIGTVACIDVNETRYLLAALSKTDIQTLKASATIHELWDCLAGIWEGVRNYSNGNCVNIPLLGSGLSGVGLPPTNLIEIILISFVDYTKKKKIADKVTLVLHSRLKGEVDLAAIKRSWT